ncbi:hypothetical protein MUK70_06505 [Dyadobacter chenwenxiniae]|uniref:Lipoprotein n=1 Tax=Dyadobacter chenwenxiniae TaxID=2906456 RepID=A0A9X1PRD1_9BACT|nr:hypothetical protein [Dyadobacter chenwenxiniae]MCF0065090.1 hypothetical protein [Dyadobacter chenwenxiniae]UON84638.1 hypothetical protein MUK70_06505 [Dyadobacter chenwenxiniae]
MTIPLRVLQIGLSFGILTACSGEKQQDTATNNIKAAYKLSELSGKKEKEVSKIYGAGTKMGIWKDARAGCVDCPKMSYKSDSVEVIFINGKSDRITLNHLQNYDFNDEVILGLLDLPVATPTFDSKSGTKRWEQYHGYRSISAFGSEGKINYILILSQAE